MYEGVDELAITLNEEGAGEWELQLDDGETIDAELTDVEITEESGFYAEGRNEPEARLFELTTGDHPGGPIRLRERSIDDEEWEDAGKVVDAAPQG